MKSPLLSTTISDIAIFLQQRIRATESLVQSSREPLDTETEELWQDILNDTAEAFGDPPLTSEQSEQVEDKHTENLWNELSVLRDLLNQLLLGNLIPVRTFLEKERELKKYVFELGDTCGSEYSASFREKHCANMAQYKRFLTALNSSLGTAESE